MKINAYEIRYAQRFLNDLKKQLKNVVCSESLRLRTLVIGDLSGYQLSLRVKGHWWICSFYGNWTSDFTVHLETDTVDHGHPDDRTFDLKADWSSDAMARVLRSLTRFIKSCEEASHASV